MRAQIVDFLYISPNKQRITIDILEDARNTYDDLKGSDIELSMKKWFPARSLSANAYAWVLINKIAANRNDKPMEVYKRCIRDCGAKIVESCVKIENMETEIATFLDGHIGRFVEWRESKLPDCVVLFKHYGSSDFDSKEMGAFLDSIIEDCRDLHIEVKPKEYIDSLLGEWDGRRKKEKT